MILKCFELKPVDRQGHWLKELNNEIKSAVSVVMYSVPAFNQGKDERTLIIFAICDEDG